MMQISLMLMNKFLQIQSTWVWIVLWLLEGVDFLFCVKNPTIFQTFYCFDINVWNLLYITDILI